MQQNTGVIVPDRCIAGYAAVCVHGERHNGFIKRVAAGGQDFPEGVGAGGDGNVGDLAVFIGVRPIGHFALLVADFDQRAGQRLFAGNVQLG